MRIVGFQRRPKSSPQPVRRLVVAGAASVLAIGVAVVGVGTPAFASVVDGVTPTTTSAGSTTSYAVGFHPTTALNVGDTITLVAPTGTVFPSVAADYDVGSSSFPASTVTVTGGNTVAIIVPTGAAIGLGGGLYVLISTVTNPAANAAYNIGVTTTGNTAQVIGPYAITGATAVTGVHLSTATPTPATGGSPATYPILFTTASALTSGVDTITITGPSGTVFPLVPGDYQTELVAGSFTTVALTPTQTAPNNVTVVVPTGYAAGAMEISAINVVNPTTAATNYTLSVSTSLDSVAGVSTSYTVTAPTAVTGLTVSPSPTTAATTSTYTIVFTDDVALSGGSTTITLTGPTGTVFPLTPGNYTVSNNGAAGAPVTATPTHSTSADVTFTVPANIVIGHTVTVVITGVTNPAVGSTTLTVGTSVDTATTIGSYTISSAGGGSSPPVVVPVTVPIAQPPVRTAGTDRFGTAIATSVLEFPTAGSARSVVISRSDDFADALVGTTLAAEKNGPLLYASGGVLTTATVAEIQRVLPAGATVYLLGGTDAIPAAVATALTSLGYVPLRISGTDRFATSVALADSLGDPTTVLLATGENFPDALAAGAAAAHLGGVVLLTDGTTLPADVQAYLTAHPGKVYAIGGPAVAADPSATPLSGADRYATAAALAAAIFTAPTTLGVASGVTFPDALSGGAFEAHANAPLLLSAPAALSPATSTYITANLVSILTANIFGGDDALSASVQTGIGTALGL